MTKFEEFMKNLEEERFSEKINAAVKILPFPHCDGEKQAEEFKKELVWECIKCKLDENESLHNLFCELCFEAGKNAVINAIKIDWDSSPKNLKSGLKNLLMSLLDEEEEDK